MSMCGNSTWERFCQWEQFNSFHHWPKWVALMWHNNFIFIIVLSALMYVRALDHFLWTKKWGYSQVLYLISLCISLSPVLHIEWNFVLKNDEHKTLSCFNYDSIFILYLLNYIHWNIWYQINFEIRNKLRDGTAIMSMV